jgi:hypothetical protein
MVWPVRTAWHVAPAVADPASTITVAESIAAVKPTRGGADPAACETSGSPHGPVAFVVVDPLLHPATTPATSTATPAIARLMVI